MTKSFQTISLEQLKKNSSFLKRIETKFLVNKKYLNDILSDFQKDYFMLQI